MLLFRLITGLWAGWVPLRSNWLVVWTHSQGDVYLSYFPFFFFNEPPCVLLVCVPHLKMSCSSGRPPRTHTAINSPILTHATHTELKEEMKTGRETPHTHTHTQRNKHRVGKCHPTNARTRVVINVERVISPCRCFNRSAAAKNLNK